MLELSQGHRLTLLLPSSPEPQEFIGKFTLKYLELLRFKQIPLPDERSHSSPLTSFPFVSTSNIFYF